MSDHEHHDDAPAARRSPSLSVWNGDRGHWRSIEERAGAPELQAASRREFPPGASELEGVPRRDFIHLLGASLALTGAACTRPNQKIVPFVRRPPEVTPGNSLDFATSYTLEGYALGLLVESQAGRPIKIEGNPLHPDSLGTTGATEQALLLDLYDDD